MRVKTLLACLVLVLLSFPVHAQNPPGPPPGNAGKVAEVDAEVRQFYDAYADDLRQHRREAIANRYDSRGYFSLGNGNKRLVSFDDNKKSYMTRWNGPKNFAWRDLSFVILATNSAAVVGLFDWTSSTGTETGSYTAVLTKQSGQWRIRVEDESFNTTGISTKVTSGNASTPGPYKYTLTIQPGTSLGSHRHSTDRKITIKSGRMFVLMGDLETAKVQRFDAGSTFVIAANTWHVEWWETETIAEVETTSPSTTERATPASPRVP